LIIYLDEAGDVGLNFENQKTSRYLVIGLLVFQDSVAGAAHIGMVQAVKRTLKNKLQKRAVELKGSKLPISVKKYFLRELNKQTNWRLYVAVADKKAWVSHHTKNNMKLGRKTLYDEIAKRIFFQVDGIEKYLEINIVVDCSKNKREIAIFDEAITMALSGRLAKNALLSIRHRSSQEDAGLQAIDIFCSGINRKYEHNDLIWYKEFAERIAVEVEYKF
jgi:hypothetical protein